MKTTSSLSMKNSLMEKRIKEAYKLVVKMFEEGIVLNKSNDLINLFVVLIKELKSLYNEIGDDLQREHNSLVDVFDAFKSQSQDLSAALVKNSCYKA